MIQLQSLSLKFTDKKMQVLDQQALPQKEIWLDVNSPADMIAYIQSLQVRGAPMIGISASLALAKYALEGASYAEYVATAQALRESRPTAVNLMNNLDRMLKLPVSEYSGANAFAIAKDIFDEDVRLCNQMAENGQALVENGDRILTVCNTGGLATVGVGTAFGVIRKAHESGKSIHVYATETRPLLQGGRLTAWELEKLKIPSTLLCDNMAAALMAEGKVDKIFVGADRVAMNGDFANKIGTYSLAVLAQYHKIPFYMVAPQTTLDPQCKSGKEIPIEQRSADEVRGVKGAFGSAQWAPSEIDTYNPAFDVTPAELVSAWVFDKAVISNSDIHSGIFNRWIKE